MTNILMIVDAGMRETSLPFSQVRRVDRDDLNTWLTGNDCLVVDVRPEIGVEIIVHLRDVTTTPIVVLCDQKEIEYRVAALQHGVGDCIERTADPRELRLRIEKQCGTVKRPASFCVDPLRHRLVAGPVTLEFTAAEFRLLSCLLDAQGRPVPSDVLLQSVGGREPIPFDRRLYTHISNIRCKCSDLLDVVSVRGVGYRAVPRTDSLEPS